MNIVMLVFIIKAGSQDVWDVIVVLAIVMDKKAMQIVHNSIVQSIGKNNGSSYKLDYISWCNSCHSKNPSSCKLHFSCRVWTWVPTASHKHVIAITMTLFTCRQLSLHCTATGNKQSQCTLCSYPHSRAHQPHKNYWSRNEVKYIDDVMIHFDSSPMQHCYTDACTINLTYNEPFHKHYMHECMCILLWEAINTQHIIL